MNNTPSTIRDPFTLATRADFAAWGTELAARLLPGLGLQVADRSLNERAWGLMSRTAGITLDLAAMKRAAADSPHPQFDFTMTALGILIHEIAHGACRPEPIKCPPLSPPQASALVKQWAINDVTAPADPVPWHDDHDAVFFRMALHVQHRAEQLLRFGILSDRIVDSDVYGCSSICLYRRALVDEPQRMTGEPFAAIRGTTPPREFVDLWRSDVTKWFAALAALSPCQLAARDAAMSLFT